jgi:hypothetical protein
MKFNQLLVLVCTQLSIPKRDVNFIKLAMQEIDRNLTEINAGWK